VPAITNKPNGIQLIPDVILNHQKKLSADPVGHKLVKLGGHKLQENYFKMTNPYEQEIKQ